jgi:hypothetical protein
MVLQKTGAKMLYSRKAGALAAFLAILLLVPSGGLHAFNEKGLVGAGLNVGAFSHRKRRQFPQHQQQFSPEI